MTKYSIVLTPTCQIKLYFGADLAILSAVRTQTNKLAILALAAAGTLWGLTVPLTKLALGWYERGMVAAKAAGEKRAYNELQAAYDELSDV